MKEEREAEKRREVKRKDGLEETEGQEQETTVNYSQQCSISRHRPLRHLIPFLELHGTSSGMRLSMGS